jgi:hypothetical protein
MDHGQVRVETLSYTTFIMINMQVLRMRDKYQIGGS